MDNPLSSIYPQVNHIMAARTSLVVLRGASRSAISPRAALPLVRSLRTSAPRLAGPSSYTETQYQLTHPLEPSTSPFSEPVGINPATKIKDVSSPLHQYGQYLLTCLPKYIQQFSIYKDELTIYVPPSAILETLQFLRDHSQCLFKSVMDITAVDYPTRKYRFEVSSSTGWS
jgi:NADH dehydrogenase (ubiquinone) Fe-S protein 3